MASLFTGFFIAAAAGLFGFTNAIRAFRAKQTILDGTILLWLAVLAALYFAVRHFLPDAVNGVYVGYAVTFFVALFSKEKK